MEFMPRGKNSVYIILRVCINSSKEGKLYIDRRRVKIVKIINNLSFEFIQENVFFMFRGWLLLVDEGVSSSGIPG